MGIKFAILLKTCVHVYALYTCIWYLWLFFCSSVLWRVLNWGSPPPQTARYKILLYPYKIKNCLHQFVSNVTILKWFCILSRKHIMEDHPPPLLNINWFAARQKLFLKVWCHYKFDQVCVYIVSCRLTTVTSNGKYAGSAYCQCGFSKHNTHQFGKTTLVQQQGICIKIYYFGIIVFELWEWTSCDLQLYS